MVLKEEKNINTFRRMSAEDDEMFVKPATNPSSSSGVSALYSRIPFR
jgi:hypothetical protein